MNVEIKSNLELIKSPDSVIREGAFSRLVEIFSNKNISVTTQDKNEYLRELCGQDYLFKGIEYGETKQSVARSFSLLVIGIIIESDKSGEVEVEKIINHILKYIELETDFRSQDKTLGWIHCLAHLGDLLAFIAFHKNISQKSIQCLCIAIIKKTSTLNSLEFLNEEDERLALGLYYSFKKLSENEALVLESIKENLSANRMLLKILDCLYLKLIADDEKSVFAQNINNCLKAFS